MLVRVVATHLLEESLRARRPESAMPAGVRTLATRFFNAQRGNPSVAAGYRARSQQRTRLVAVRRAVTIRTVGDGKAIKLFPFPPHLGPAPR